MTGSRAGYDHVAGIYLPIAAAVFVIVAALLLFVVLRGRRGGHERPAASAPKLEGVYALALIGIAAVLVTVTLRTDAGESRVGPRPDLTIHVIAAQWSWRFEYPGGVTEGNGRDVPTLVVPAGRPVRFTLTSLDVVHAFWIPDLRFKRDATPGTVAEFDIRFPGSGGWAGAGECSEFCGLDHSSMRFFVRALSPQAFTTWLDGRRRPS